MTSLPVIQSSAGFLQDGADCTLTRDRDPELPRYGLQCRWAPLSDLDPVTLAFPGGAPVQLHAVPPALLPRIPLFYVCTTCGKVFWEGSHFGRVVDMFREVLHVTDDDTLQAHGAEPDGSELTG